MFTPRLADFNPHEGTQFVRTHSRAALACTHIESGEFNELVLQFLNISSANKVAILCWLNCITETVQVSEGRRYFLLEGHMLVSPGFHSEESVFITLQI